MVEGKWAARLGKWALWLALAGLALAAIGVVLARYDVVAKFGGFTALLLGGGIALLALLAGLTSVLMPPRGAAARRGRAIAAIVLAVPLVGFLGSRPMSAGDVPAIHDVTTDPANPPQFRALTLRADNLAGVETLDNWRALHRQAYGELRPLHVTLSVPEVMERARGIALEEGWKIAAFSSDEGRLEAKASVSFIRFYDDVVIEATPAPEGEGSVVNMRSVSRIGISDFGVNAARIRAFLARLAGA
ncbi:MAG: hypothetical protein A3J40_13185 [Erythrobacter sp. RIFCSPHIGHO2_12_FULL_63_10]|nr:MAG: hypothetical protein A3J40_13185 [Erythrobacter sp. RIFCSPHIGHO2_12_FULL_63_10]